MGEIKVPVIVVGGGGCGLAASIMLSNLGVEHVLFESHPATAHLPKASLLNQRTAEILDQHGIWQEILKIGCPPDKMKYYQYTTSLGGKGPFDRYEFCRIPCYGCNNDPGYDEDFAIYRKHSAYSHSNLPLIRLEPLLRSEAERRNPGKILFNHKVIGFHEEIDRVTVEVVNRATNQQSTYVADYVIAADGGKTIGPTIGISYEGIRNLADTTSIHFKADLSKYWEEGMLINYIVGLQGQEGAISSKSSLFGGNWSAIVVTGPSWGRKSEEWVLHLSLGQDHKPLDTFSEAELVQVIRDTLKIPELEPEILISSRWQIDAVLAERYQTKRIFLAGDAAHRHPPFAGLGLNTAFGDAHNLTWKLAAVLKGEARESLLLSYEPERRPAGRRVVDWAILAFLNIRLLDSASGLLPGGASTLKMNERTLAALTSDTFDGEARRAIFRYAVDSQRVETAAHDIELGAVYETGVLVPDGSNPHKMDPRGNAYIPIARPGHRMPHVWLQGRENISTFQLIDDKGTWVLFTDTSDLSQKWFLAVDNLVARTGLKVNIVRIGAGGNYEDHDGQWMEDSGMEADQAGVVLVRPDQYIAFRATKFSPQAMADFSKITEMLEPVH
jgi:2,4-dichlorophenol 6-monooxygenase